MNKVLLIGNLGRDPEVARTQTGDRYARLSVATSENWRDKASGEKRQRTEWHNVVIWGDGLVGVVEQYAKKGSKVIVEGKLCHRKWQDRTGQDRYTTEIVVQGFGTSFQMLSNSGGGREEPPVGEPYGYGVGSNKDAAAPPPAEAPFDKQIDTEIPF